MKKLPNDIKDFQNCPNCGSDCGYYTKDYMQGSFRWHHKFDGSEAENTESLDTIPTKNGKVAYCAECDKKIANIL